MRFQGEMEHELEETLLEELLPSDSGGYSEQNLITIERMKNNKVLTESDEITEKEVENALNTMGKKKAPGCDDLTAEIINKCRN